MPTQTFTRNTCKRSTNVYLTATLVDKRRSMGMNLLATLDILLAHELQAKSIEREKEKEDMRSMN
ncbi:UNVERIFIED_ORG: antitoxin CcdA [Citrobacter freundii]